MLALLLSVVDVEIVAEFDNVEPAAALGLVETTSWNVAVSGFAKLAAVQLTVAPPVQLNTVVPPVWVIETKLVPGGNVALI